MTISHPGDHIFYDVLTDFHFLWESLKQQGIDYRSHNKTRYIAQPSQAELNDCLDNETLLYRLIEEAFVSPRSVCLLHLLRCFKEWELLNDPIGGGFVVLTAPVAPYSKDTDTAGLASNEEEGQDVFAVSVCFFWTIVKHLDLVAELSKLTWFPSIDCNQGDDSALAALLPAFLVSYLDHLFAPPILPGDRRQLLKLMMLSWQGREDSALSMILLRLFKTRAGQLASLCSARIKNQSDPEEITILLTTCLNLVEEDAKMEEDEAVRIHDTSTTCNVLKNETQRLQGVAMVTGDDSMGGMLPGDVTLTVSDEVSRLFQIIAPLLRRSSKLEYSSAVEKMTEDCNSRLSDLEQGGVKVDRYFSSSAEEHTTPHVHALLQAIARRPCFLACLEQDLPLLTDDQRALRLSRDRCLVRAARILIANEHELQEHQQLLHQLVSAVVCFLGRQYTHVLQAVSPHVDCLASYWLERGIGVVDVVCLIVHSELMYEQFCNRQSSHSDTVLILANQNDLPLEEGEATHTALPMILEYFNFLHKFAVWFFSCDFPDLQDSDRMLKALLPHRRALSTLEVCQSMMNRISLLVQQRTPVDGYHKNVFNWCVCVLHSHKLLCLCLAGIGPNAASHLLADALLTSNAVLMEPSSYTTSLRRVLNRLVSSGQEEDDVTTTTESEAMSTWADGSGDDATLTPQKQLYLLLLTDPLQTLLEMFRYGVRHKGSTRPILASLTAFNFSFPLRDPVSPSPLLVRALDALLFNPSSSASAVGLLPATSADPEQRRRLDSLLAGVLTFCHKYDNHWMLDELLVGLVVPNLRTISDQLEMALLLLSHIFPSASTPSYSSNHRRQPSQIVTASLLCALIGLLSTRALESRDLDETERLVLLLASYAADAEDQMPDSTVTSQRRLSHFLFAYLDSFGTCSSVSAMTSRLLCLRLYQSCGRFLELPGQLGTFLDSVKLEKHYLRCLDDPSAGQLDFPPFLLLLHFASGTPASLLVAIATTSRSLRLTSLTPGDVTLCLLEFLTDASGFLRADSWHRAVQFLIHLSRSGLLNLPYRLSSDGTSNCSHLLDLRSYRGYLDILSLLLTLIGLLASSSSAIENKTCHRSAQLILAAVRLLAKPPLAAAGYSSSRTSSDCDLVSRETWLMLSRSVKDWTLCLGSAEVVTLLADEWCSLMASGTGDLTLGHHAHSVGPAGDVSE